MKTAGTLLIAFILFVPRFAFSILLGSLALVFGGGNGMKTNPVLHETKPQRKLK